VIVIIPPTGGTRVDASAAAAAAQRADHEQERDADENIDELVVTHGFLFPVGLERIMLLPSTSSPAWTG
jgi:hypothetical protein